MNFKQEKYKIYTHPRKLLRLKNTKDKDFKATKGGKREGEKDRDSERQRDREN